MRHDGNTRAPREHNPNYKDSRHATGHDKRSHKNSKIGNEQAWNRDGNSQTHQGALWQQILVLAVNYRFSPNWHCIVGKNFTTFVTYESRHYIHFEQGQVSIVLFKFGWASEGLQSQILYTTLRQIIQTIYLVLHCNNGPVIEILVSIYYYPAH